jgi:hypothetical protein
MATPVRFPGGVTNARPNSAAYQLGIPDPTSWHQMLIDFDDYAATDWVITTTEAGAGSATEATSDADGGILVVTNDAADNDADFFQWAGVDSAAVRETYTLTSGKKLFFKARWKVSDATQADYFVGLHVADTTPVGASAPAVSDGIMFYSTDGAATLDFYHYASSSATSATSVATVTSDTYLETAFYYDGGTSIEAFVNDAKVATLTPAALATTELALSFGIQNGEAVAKIMSIDFLYVAKER